MTLSFPLRTPASALAGCALLAVLGACAEPEPERSPEPQFDPCPMEQTEPAAISGVYSYSSSFYVLRGTITLTRDGTRVRVDDTTYENANDRALRGEGELQGNRLDVELTPKNGDTNYSANVSFLFDDEGFCLLGFSDTNGDRGGEGSYRGYKL